MVAVKRENRSPSTPSPSFGNAPSSISSNSTTPGPSPSKKVKAAGSTPVKKEGTTSSRLSQNGSLTPDKREALIETILAHGLKSISYTELAPKLGISVTQLRNATQAGKKGNLRYKAAKSVRGD